MFGLFSNRKNKAEIPAEPPPPALGWEAIQKAFAGLYPGQTPKHLAPNGVRRMHDLNNPPQNPCDGFSIYDGDSFWHYVTFGLSDLYEKGSTGDSAGDDWSGFGYELTMRVGKQPGEKEPPFWPIPVFVSLGRAAFSGAKFAPGHSVKVGPLDGNADTKLTALLITKDPGFELQQTPFGKLAFLQLVGVPNETRERGLQVGIQVVVDELLASDKNLVTRL